MLRLGLCCAFRDQQIRFRTTTAAAMQRLSVDERLEKLGELARSNAESLLQAVTFCAENGIGSFRILSQILPLKTHPTVGYSIERLPDHREIVEAFRTAGRAASRQDVRLTFHPDQYLVLNSPKPEVVNNSIAELEYHAEVAEWIGADVIMLHGGGAYGDKAAALSRLAASIEQLPKSIRAKIALENDDRIFSPADLLPLCESLPLPFVYDAHHHRCLPDGDSIGVVTRRAVATWDREPLFHISSPAGGWTARDPRVHDEFVELRDFPDEWRDLRITVEVEARAKELAVLRLAGELKAGHPALDSGEAGQAGTVAMASSQIPRQTDPLLNPGAGSSKSLGRDRHPSKLRKGPNRK